MKGYNVAIIEGAGVGTAGPALAEVYLKAQGAVQVQFKRLHDDAVVPARAHATDAGFDLSAYTSQWTTREKPMTVLSARGRMVIPTGVAVVIPEGYVGLVCPRSGLAANHGITITNAPGIIDSGYRGELMIILQNTRDVPFTIHHGDRIAQLVVVPALHIDAVEIDELPEADRGANGGGSTGV